MPTRRPAERTSVLAATQHGLITARQCRDLGLSRNAVQRLVAAGAWGREAPGVYRITGAPRTWHGRALAAALAAGPDAVVSHRSAAHLWGLEGFGPTGRIDVTVPRHTRRRPRAGVVVHESSALHLAGSSRRWRVPVTGPARTFIDVAAEADDDLVALRALDEIRRLRLATWCELWESLLLHARSGRNGISQAREALRKRHRKRVPDTEFARLFLRLLDAAGLPAPLSEHDVTVGSRHYRVDCAYPDRQIAIELDGKGHLEEPVYSGDRVRDNQLELHGWIVLRYTWRRFVTSPDDVVAEVRAALTAER